MNFLIESKYEDLLENTSRSTSNSIDWLNHPALDFRLLQHKIA
jgi:hypothetical protein